MLMDEIMFDGFYPITILNILIWGWCIIRSPNFLGEWWDVAQKIYFIHKRKNLITLLGIMVIG